MQLPARRAPLWVIVAFALGFVLASLVALVSDVTRDDVAAYHNGFDASRYSTAEVGSFYEVSAQGISGPLCQNTIESRDKFSTLHRNVVIKNKLGETVPFLANILHKLLGPKEVVVSSNAHEVRWQIKEYEITLDELGGYVRNVMNEDNEVGTCGALIDSRTQNRDVRICPVQRVWKNESGETVTFFFDTMAINGCRESSVNCSSDCPRYESGQFWTSVKIQLDLIEAGV